MTFDMYVNEELHNLYSSPNIIKQIKSRQMRWAGHLARMGRTEKCTRFWWESSKETDHAGDQGVDGSMGSEWILGRLAGRVDWIRLDQDRDRWLAVWNTMINFQFLAQWSYLFKHVLYILF
jgi:hypothetical protein